MVDSPCCTILAVRVRTSFERTDRPVDDFGLLRFYGDVLNDLLDSPSHNYIIKIIGVLHYKRCYQPNLKLFGLGGMRISLMLWKIPSSGG